MMVRLIKVGFLHMVNKELGFYKYLIIFFILLSVILLCLSCRSTIVEIWMWIVPVTFVASRSSSLTIRSDERCCIFVYESWIPYYWFNEVIFCIDSTPANLTNNSTNSTLSDKQCNVIIVSTFNFNVFFFF